MPSNAKGPSTALVGVTNSLYSLRPVNRSDPVKLPPTPSTNSITIICISDTHTTKPDLPSGDLLIHAGDLSQSGSFVEVQAQLSWLAAQPHRHKIVIAGNHDLILDPAFVDRFPERIIEEEGASRDDLNWGDVLYLCDKAVTLDFDGGRKLTIYGSPWTQQFGNWAFQYPPIRDVWTGKIPPGTDILVTHGPPLGVRDDGGKGNLYLMKELRRARPGLVVFGHIHAGHGAEEQVLDVTSSTYEDILAGRSGWWGLSRLLYGLIAESIRRLSGRDDVICTKFVNAAVVGGRDNQFQRPAQVVTI